jgi:peroxiredoxin
MMKQQNSSVVFDKEAMGVPLQSRVGLSATSPLPPSCKGGMRAFRYYPSRSRQRFFNGLLCAILLCTASASQAQQHTWAAQLHRSDGVAIPFIFEWRTKNKKPVWIIRNAQERIEVTAITQQGDSVFAQMPVFESQFRAQLINKGKKLNGVWIKGGSVSQTVMPFTANWQQSRFKYTSASTTNVSGRWAVEFAGAKNGASVGEFLQKGTKTIGTFLNPTGDYRYLEGTTDGDTLRLSCFDGGHAFLFTAFVAAPNKLEQGFFYSGASFKQSWTAQKNANATVPQDKVAMYAKPGEEQLHFSFLDIDSNRVSITDEQFKNKVVIIQLMGSWCPNCMDETEFLSNYYRQNKQRGVAVIALAYEYSTQWQRSANSLRKFKDKYNVQYPILITGVTVGDSLRTEKTLPEITPIRFFPSSIVLDKNGKIRKLDTGFNGPGTGIHHELWRKEFEATVNGLLAE